MKSFSDRMNSLAASQQALFEKHVAELKILNDAIDILSKDMGLEIARLTRLHGPSLAEEPIDDLPIGIIPDQSSEEETEYANAAE